MNIPQHFIISSIITIALFPFYKWWSLLAIAGGVLVDIDHFIWWLVIKKDFNLKKAHRYFKYKYTGNKNLTLIFHCVEFWILKLVIVILFPLLLPFLIGLYVHMAMDLYNFYKYRKTHPKPIAYSLLHKYIIKKYIIKKYITKKT